jgi:NADH:ubiquinone oxidoreductase subunit 6 (subunit J)
LNIWMLLGAIAVLWVFSFSMMYLSFWLEERRERKRERQVAKRLRVTVGENVIPLDGYRLDKYRKIERR